MKTFENYTTAAQEVFNEIKAEMEADRKAAQELAREYFTNPTFRRALEQYVWELNNPKQS